MTRAKKMQQRGILLCIVVIAAVMLIPNLPILKSAAASAVRFESDRIALKYPDGAEEDVLYSDVLSAKYLSAFDPGECVSGGREDRCKWGVWRNEAYGEYHLCVNTDFPEAVCLTTDQGVYVINYESAGVTRGLADNIQSIITAREK